MKEALKELDFLDSLLKNFQGGRDEHEKITNALRTIRAALEGARGPQEPDGDPSVDDVLEAVQ